MKNLTRILAAIAVVTIAGSTPTLAQSRAELDFVQAKRQRDDEIARAIKPINDRYVALLKQQLNHLNPGTDAATIANITQEIKNMGDAGGMDTKQIVGEWLFFRDDKPTKGTKRNLLPDGTVTTDDGTKGKWEITGSKLVMTYSNGGVSELDLPIKNGKLQGTTNKGHVNIRAEKK